jgi:hypothetical protein
MLEIIWRVIPTSVFVPNARMDKEEDILDPPITDGIMSDYAV